MIRKLLSVQKGLQDSSVQESLAPRSLQLSLGAPPLINFETEPVDTVSIAVSELEAKILPISIRRTLPNGLYQDIPIDWLK